MSAVPEYPQRHLVSAEEYLRMGEAGVFDPDARLELIEGEIIEMAPIGSPHASLVSVLNRLFVRRAGAAAVVWVQCPVVLHERSVPQPDLALVKPRADDYRESHPTAAEILLAVEVSDTTLRFDIGRKAPLYARCAIPELWIVDVGESVVRVYREPSASGYRESFTAGRGERVACVLLPEVFVAVPELFPSR